MQNFISAGLWIKLSITLTLMSYCVCGNFFVSGTLASLQKQPFLLAPCLWDISQGGTSATQ